MRISDWSSDVCSSDLDQLVEPGADDAGAERAHRAQLSPVADVEVDARGRKAADVLVGSLDETRISDPQRTTRVAVNQAAEKWIACVEAALHGHVRVEIGRAPARERVVQSV